LTAQREYGPNSSDGHKVPQLTFKRFAAHALLVGLVQEASHGPHQSMVL